LRNAGTNIQVLAENGVEIFFTQVFRHNFFHADMHPGNIFVQVDDPDNPKYAAVDFGIVGTLNPEDQQYLAGNFLAFFDRDYHKIAKLHIDSGWVPAETRIDELEAAVRSVCEPIFNKPLSEISFAQVIMRLFETARRFNMEIQPQLILLHKTLFNIEGLGRELYPQLDLWKTAHPILKRWMEEQMGPRAVLKQIREDLPQAREALRELPGVVHYLSQQISRGKLWFRLDAPELAEIRDQLRKQQRQRYWLAVGATAVITGTLILTWGFLPAVAWALISIGIIGIFIGRPSS
ncbi:MAG: ubiquinone biosynthesis regulatory protein kinase UbiB, partial [Woeseiaceae bacterium]|nr:ubiquinone biosynthesis regulatory protein kinase UbiB [Woeseiaceae bacterium]